MRIHSLLAVLLCACVSNPDPRKPSLENVERSGYGGWIVMTTRQGARIEGELISVEGVFVRVLHYGRLPLLAVQTTEIASAELFKYESEGFGAWGALGSVSALSHGFFLVLSIPVWLISTGVVSSIESRSVILHYPEDSWAELAKWARFPQGMPEGIDERALIVPQQKLGSPGNFEPPPTSAPANNDHRAEAWELTKQAQAAARMYDCLRVNKLNDKVLLLDPEFHRVVFIADAAIKRCLDAAKPNVPTP
jgi:hypothetical protein